jgi:SAM-dependent methyltransferase
VDKRLYYRDPAVAARYDNVRFRSEAGRLTHRVELEAVRSAFGPRQTVVELACGTGRLLRALRAEDWNVWGLDQSRKMLEAGGAPGRLVVGDVFRLPLQDGSVDGLYCFRFTNHFADLDGFFRECGRVLKKGGRLVFDSMRWSPLLWDSERLGGRNHCAPDRRIAAWLGRSGLAVESVRPLFPVGPYLLGALPAPVARILLASARVVPAPLQAVALWHARKD